MTTVYLIRHAQAEGNLYRRCHGWYNSRITPKGHRQIAALEEHLKDIHFDAVYSSDLCRTMTTAQAICRPHSLPLQLDPDLREIGMGIWEDWTWGEAIQADRKGMEAFFRCDPHWYTEGGETIHEVQERFCSAVERHAKSHPGQTIAVVAHGAVIRISVARWKGLPLDRILEVPLGDNTAVTCLEIENGNVNIRYYADISHLGDLATPPRPEYDPDESFLSKMERDCLYFHPLDLSAHTDLYLDYRRDGWMASHGTMDHFNGNAFLETALRNYTYDPASIQLAYANDTPVGMLQLDMEQDAELGVGRVPFFYIRPEFRSRGYGMQLLGQALSIYRSQCREYLRLRCAPENSRAKKFYEQNGFCKIGEEPGGTGHLDTMQMYIGYD